MSDRKKLIVEIDPEKLDPRINKYHMLNEILELNSEAVTLEAQIKRLRLEREWLMFELAVDIFKKSKEPTNCAAIQVDIEAWMKKSLDKEHTPPEQDKESES